MAAETVEDLAEIPAGSRLSAALHGLPLSQVPNDRILDRVKAQARQANHEDARLAATLVELARCDAVSVPGAVTRRAEADEWATHESRAALHWTNSRAESEHALAEFVIGHLPDVFDAWYAGAIDRPRVRLFEQYLFGLTPEQIAEVCASSVPQAGDLTTGQLAALLKRLVVAIDPDAAARWYRRSVRERGVCAYLAPDGTVTITAHGLPADQAQAACDRVERLASTARRAGHPGPIASIRADVHLGLLDGRFHTLDAEQIVAALIADHYSAEAAADSEDAEGRGAGARPDSLAMLRRSAAQGAANRPASDAAAANPDDVPPFGGEPDDPDDDGPDDDGPDDDGPDDDGPDDDGPDDDGPDDDGPDDGVPPHRGPDRDGPNGSDPHPGSSAVHAADQRRGIEIRIALSTLLGRDDHPGEIPGLGPVPAHVARACAIRQTRSEWRFAVTTASGTRLVSEGHTARRPFGASRAGAPPGGIVEIHLTEDLLAELAAALSSAGVWAAVVADIVDQHDDYERHLADLDADPSARLPARGQRRHTEIRDRTCSFAGVCRRPAHHCDQDHRVEHRAGGPTVVANLGPVCPMDHAVKHRAGWTNDLDTDGALIWRSPLGGHYPARAEFLTIPLTQPVTGRAVRLEQTDVAGESDVGADPVLDRRSRRARTEPGECGDDRSPPF